MKFTAASSLLAAAAFTVAQTGPSLQQDFAGLLFYLTGSVNDANDKLVAADPKNPLILKVSNP